MGLIERSFSAADGRATQGVPAIERGLPVASLLFARGSRPSAGQVHAFAAANPSLLVSYDPEDDADNVATASSMRWLEVMANGLTYDLAGLAPGDPQPLPPGNHLFGLPPDFDGEALEAVSLRPGSEISGAGQKMPVVRSMARLAAALAEMPGVCAVGWHPARALSAPAHFRGSILRWLDGGVFPGLGLTALAPLPDGSLQSEGLALFTGQELRLAPELASDRAAGARLAVRLLHWLVEHGRLHSAAELTAPSGRPLMLDLSANGRYVGVSEA